ncbi:MULTISPECIES: ABC transporter permease [unclassified Bacillus (in: firmicutes)]|uniref:ABC transporter permease n=1 Tax=unclassified Bacillus (in: firmicutes) TaxID=185979 RepID=UPI0008E1ACC1|nr:MULTISPECIES: ABC transporter permease [unclassified Bacillus (in: firmicutes)]SFJ20953.1 ABC-2 type transport system permease protein [Bacillus sp. 71mf]SFT12755.1 ABC-2 type transport system permease protein [Bacillus sp. 103mf]
MSEFANLVYNEAEKIYRKKRIVVVMLILAILIPIFVYAQYREVQTTVKRLGTSDWKVSLQQQIVDSQNRLNNSRLPEEWKSWLKIRVQQQQYYLDHNINPSAPGAPTFVRMFIEQGITLFIPLLIMIVAIDIVSGERSDGTMKMLLTRPIRRWKILLSKYVTMVLFISFILLLASVLSYVLSGIVFGYAGWNLPVLTGFITEKETLNTSFVHLIPQWQYIVMAYGLAWFVAIVVGTISFMVSVLIRNTPAGMGIMLAALIAGGILNNFATSWEGAKYIFSVNLSLTDYLSGQLPALQGLSMSFSLMNLTIWAAVSLIIAFAVFTKQDMVN